MRSPQGGHELRRLEGTASDIWSRGDAWVSLAGTMEETASELTAIGDSCVHTSKGTDKLAELATETAVDLAAASVRYLETGKVLRVYGTALDVAQTWIHPRIDDIEAAELEYTSALEASESAQNSLTGLDNVWPWEAEPTEAQRTSARDAASTAAGALRGATSDRNELWQQFDSTFVEWSDAYDAAVDGIEKAMDTAGNNDGFWEAVDNVIDAIAIILIVLTVVALIIGAPFTGLLALAMLVLALASLALNVLKFAYGKATVSDVAWGVVALIPFGIGGLLGKGVPVLRTVIKGGRGVVTQAIRAGLPRVSLLRPGSWATPVRSLFAPVKSWLSLPGPGTLVNPLTTIRMGGPSSVQVQTFLGTMRNSPWASNPAVSNFITATDGLLPGTFRQFGNVGNWFVNGGLQVADVQNWLPAMPGPGQARVSW